MKTEEILKKRSRKLCAELALMDAFRGGSFLNRLERINQSIEDPKIRVALLDIYAGLLLNDPMIAASAPVAMRKVKENSELADLVEKYKDSLKNGQLDGIIDDIRQENLLENMPILDEAAPSN